MGNFPKITGHMIVKNEDRFVWYAISSILPYVDRLLITDTGSKDQTLPLIESFKSEKISLIKCEIKRPEDVGKVRQLQIENTMTDWFWIIDGDEVYPHSLSEEILSLVMKGDSLEGIVVGRYDLLGDIYHHQSESIGAYNLYGKRGHIVLRLIHKKNIQGLHTSGTYPYEGYYDGHGKELIYHDSRKYVFTRGKMWHAMYLQRSSIGANLNDTFHRKKWKIELGISIPDTVSLPEVFTKNRPMFVPNVNMRRSFLYIILASILTPIKRLKRSIAS